MNELEKVIDKYFKDDKYLYYTPYDSIRENQYLYWEYHQRKRNEILISIGSDEGEVRVKVFTDVHELESFIKLVIYS